MNPAIFGIKPVGRSWTKNQISTSATDAYYDICWNGSTYLIVGTSGASARVLTASAPSGTWTTRSSSPYSGSTLTGCISNGSRFVAVGSAGIIYSNDSGVTWNAATASGAFQGVAWNGSIFVAVGSGSNIATSTDGITWTTRTSPAGGWYHVSYGGGLFVVVGAGGALATSPDGITWTSRTSGTSDTLYRVVYKAGVWLAVVNNAAGKIIYSFNGLSWSLVTLPAGSEYLLCATVHKNWFLTAGQASALTPNEIWRSISGLTNGWTSSTTGVPSNSLIRSIMSDGTNIISVYNDTSDNGVLISS